MYLISEVFKKRGRDITKGKYVCNVFYVSSLKTNPYDITNQVADKFNLTYKDGSIEIGHGCGTGLMRLKTLLEGGDKNILVCDVSVFNS